MDRHTPYAHNTHESHVPCGCALNVYIKEILTCKCGASYEWKEVVTFPVWRCYDCGRMWRLKYVK